MAKRNGLVIHTVTIVTAFTEPTSYYPRLSTNFRCSAYAIESVCEIPSYIAVVFQMSWTVANLCRQHIRADAGTTLDAVRICWARYSICSACRA